MTVSLKGILMRLKKNTQKPYINATFIPEAARICSNPEFINEAFIYSGGETASSPKTIPPKISRFGDLKYWA